MKESWKKKKTQVQMLDVFGKVKTSHYLLLWKCWKMGFDALPYSFLMCQKVVWIEEKEIAFMHLFYNLL